jgi:uncharacterized protein with NRDE domain
VCTLILGVGVLGPGSVIVAANRDEDPERPSDPPGPLSDRLNLVGGRDRRSGGTWLAIRDARAAVAVLNRGGARPAPGDGMRSRGLLALDVAAVSATGKAFAAAALEEATASVTRHAYAPFSLVCATPEASWVLGDDGERRREPQAVGPGWHVLTHGELDDPDEPRTARLTAKLSGYIPASVAEAETRLLEVLGLHGSFGDGAPPEPGDREAAHGPPTSAAVCIHAGRMVTVSASLFRVSGAGTRYIHIEGRPCTTPPRDLSSLIAT